MAQCELSIEFDNPGATFRAGEPITGNVRVRTTGEVRCDGLNLLLCLTRKVGGRSERRETPAATLFKGTWPGGAARSYPFSVPSPASPPTWSGKALGTSWAIDATADVPWAIDARTTREFTLLPPPGGPAPLEDPRAPALRRFVQGSDTGRIVTGVLGCLPVLFLVPFVLAGLGSFVFLLFLFFLAPPEQGPGAEPPPPLPLQLVFFLIPLLFVGVPFLILRPLLSAWMRRRRLGEILVSASAATARPGEALRVKVTLRPPAACDIASATLDLAVEEGGSMVVGSGKNRRTVVENAVLHAAAAPLVHPRRVEAGRPIVLEGTLTIPPGAPGTFVTPDAWVRCAVRAAVTLPRWGAERAEVLVHIPPREG
ncbi:MAG: hypothetical protein HUU06_08875 [Planctomycetaceae bacterium]|nr:hypothetical protein [Planctomycetaceae bacterium]